MYIIIITVDRYYSIAKHLPPFCNKFHISMIQ